MYCGLAFSKGFPNLIKPKSSGNSIYNQNNTVVSLLTYKYTCLSLPLAVPLGTFCRSDVCSYVIEM